MYGYVHACVCEMFASVYGGMCMEGCVWRDVYGGMCMEGCVYCTSMDIYELIFCNDLSHMLQEAVQEIVSTCCVSIANAKVVSCSHIDVIFSALSTFLFPSFPTPLSLATSLPLLPHLSHSSPTPLSLLSYTSPSSPTPLSLISSSFSTPPFFPLYLIQSSGRRE